MMMASSLNPTLEEMMFMNNLLTLPPDFMSKKQVDDLNEQSMFIQEDKENWLETMEKSNLVQYILEMSDYMNRKPKYLIKETSVPMGVPKMSTIEEAPPVTIQQLGMNFLKQRLLEKYDPRIFEVGGQEAGWGARLQLGGWRGDPQSIGIDFGMDIDF